MGSFEIARQLFLDGLDLLKNGDATEAELKFLASLEQVPDRASTLTNLSAAQYRLGKFDQAAASARRAIAVDGASSEAWLNMGNSLQALRRYVEALAHYDRAIALKPDSAEAWSNRGATLAAQKRFDEALAHYDRAIALNPAYAHAWTNKGLALRECRRHAEAMAQHERAIALEPGYAEAWLNQALTLVDLQRYDEAFAHFDRAIALKPGFAEAWANKALALRDLRRHDEAISHYERALTLKPDLDFALADLIHTLMLAGDWRGLEGIADKLVTRLRAAHAAVPPFVFLSIDDSPVLQLEAARAWVKSRFPATSTLPAIGKRSHERIRIGYFSADFRSHPVAVQTVELFELHDRKRFEVFGFSLQTASHDDEMRTRLENAFDQFIDVESDSDLEIAKRSRALEIDIAVDLGGHTHGARTAAFSHRAAPVQVNYLGYPGTMGAEYMDYLLADKVVCPPQNLPWCTEKLAWLPHCFMPHDSTQEISARVFTRQEFGLPETGFVFCCFNNHYKLNPAAFDVWMRLLAKVPGSALWLSGGQQVAKDNLAKEARARGVDPARLVHASRLDSMAEHLGRLRLADLFIDTLPYNAHTTACDALWAGVPVLTCTGQSFASRVAASLLHAVGLPELVTGSLADYEALALELAAQPRELAALRDKLAANRLSTPLFDTRQLARDMEQAYAAMFERLQNGLAPDNIEI